MSSTAGIKAKDCNKQSKQNGDGTGQRPKFCQSLFYLLPCFRKKSSPSSSRSSSKTSKHNFFLENHYIVKCPKKRDTQCKEDKKNKEEVEKIAEPSDSSPLSDVGKLPNQKEVRFLGAAKRHSERNDYLKLLGMEPNDYLNQFSSVFIKNLKTPIPKDPTALPKKFNVYVPPKKSNRSLLSMNQVSDVRNVSHNPKPRRTLSINRSISSVVKEKCAAFQKNFDIFNKKTEENVCNEDSPCRISSIEDLDSTSDTLHKYSANINNEVRSPWQCSNSNGLYKYGEVSSEQRNSKYKLKDVDLICDDESTEKQKVKLDFDDQSKSHIQRLKRYFGLNSRGVNSKQESSITEARDMDDGCSHDFESKENYSASEKSVEDEVSDKNPWPRHNFLQLHAINGSTNVFRGADMSPDLSRSDNHSGKTLIWKLLIKNQKEYIQS